MQCPAIFNLLLHYLFDSLGRLPYKVILLTLSFHEIPSTIRNIFVYVPSRLLQVLNANNLIICNTGTTPTFVGSRGNSCIDFTICNLAGINLIHNWKVDQGKSLSDHEAICYSLDLGNRTSFASRSPAKCDWQLYETLVSSSFDMSPFWFKPVVTSADLDDRQLFISNTLLRSFEQVCPLTRGTRRSTVPWWNSELTKAKQSAKALRRKFNRKRNSPDWELYAEANRRYANLIRTAKRQNW